LKALIQLNIFDLCRQGSAADLRLLESNDCLESGSDVGVGFFAPPTIVRPADNGLGKGRSRIRPAAPSFRQKKWLVFPSPVERQVPTPLQPVGVVAYCY